jgi:hypothetical protein
MKIRRNVKRGIIKGSKDFRIIYISGDIAGRLSYQEGNSI